jgi:TolB-like protein
LRAPAVFALALLIGACASNPASRRATVIADADKAAKAALAAENTLDPAKIPARTFAVLPFTVAMKDTIIEPLRFGLADLLIADLSRTPELQLVERIQTNAILRELQLVEEGIADPRQAPRVGRLIGARRLLLGSATMTDARTMRLDARVVDVIAGTVQDVLSASAPIDRVIDAEKALALLVIERLGITLTPAQRLRIEERQTTQLAALVAYGKGVQAEARGDAILATASFAEASRLDAAFASARQVAGNRGPAANRSSRSQRAQRAQRAANLATKGVNAQIHTRLSEAVDAPLARGSEFIMTFVIRVTP